MPDMDSYEDTVDTLVTELWSDEDDKVSRLWPNSSLPDNYVSPDEFNDSERQFTSPGFLFMQNP